MNAAGLARADLKNLLRGALSPMLVFFDSEEPGTAQAYARITPVGLGDTYEKDRRAFQNPRYQVDIYTYALNDSEALRAGEAAEDAVLGAGWRVTHPRSPLGFEGQMDAQKKRWYSHSFDAENLY